MPKYCFSITTISKTLLPYLPFLSKFAAEKCYNNVT